ncbi:MAG: response regulator transcription factor [Sandaracinaceae bacterium]
MRLRAVLVDDHRLVRAGLRRLLEGHPRVEVVGEAGEGRAALSLLEELEPDLLVTDIGLPGLNGLDVAKQALAANPKLAVIVLSVHAEPAYVHRALELGVRGYVLKDGAPEELALAVDAIDRGGKYLSPSVASAVVDTLVGGGTIGTTPLDLLTDRQREILQLIAEGKSTKEIASTLFISIKTVESHRAQLAKKLDAKNVAELTRLAVRYGLIDA